MTLLQLFDGASQAGRVTIIHNGCRNDDGTAGGFRFGVSFPASDTEAVAEAEQSPSASSHAWRRA